MNFFESAVLEKLQWIVDKKLGFQIVNIDGESNIHESLSTLIGPFYIKEVIPEIEDLFGVMIEEVFDRFVKINDLVRYLIYENIDIFNKEL